MFKKLLSMVAIAGMVMTTSCSSDEFEPAQNGGEAVVSFTTELPSSLQSRAFGDGTTAKNLSYFVYDENWNYLTALSAENGETMNGLTATVNLQLVNGETYNVVFWADAENAPYTFNTNDATVAMNYDNAAANDENRDAFYKVENFTVNGNMTRDVELTRPFAQINIGTTDWAEVVKNTNVKIEKTSIKVKAYSTLNFKDGDATDETTAEFELANMPDGETFPVENVGVDKYLAMNYILVDEKELVNVTINYDGGVDSRTFTAVPVQRNYRTNIYGKLITSDEQFNVEINPIFEGEWNNELTEPWDGTADTSWYNESDSEFTLSSHIDLAGFAKLVNEEGVTFEGKTVKLDADIDLEGYDANDEKISFRPIGDQNSGSVFKGTFDGNGHTIKNLYQSGWAFGYEWGAYGSFGLFGIADNCTVKNLTIEGTTSEIEGGDVAFICGSATGTCVFENITITNGNIATYNNGNGSIIGWSGAGNYTFKNITLGEDVCLTGLWGSFDSSIGGIVGQAEPGATYNFENVEINCVMNVFNDCTASYDYYNYRMCGMIIGRCQKTTTIDGTNYPDTSQYNITCTNVVVNYGDWMNYHYCDPTPGYNNGRGMRYESGYSYGGLDVATDYDHSQCTNHHYEWIPFNQLIGGDQYGVKGLPTYEGVTVNYPQSYYDELNKNQ